MIDIEYLDLDTKDKVIKLREFIKTEHYKKLIDNYDNRKILFSLSFLTNILKYDIEDIINIFERLNKAVNLLDNEILILYTENYKLKLSLYIHNYSYGEEKIKDMIKKYFKDTIVEFNDLNIKQDACIIADDVGIVKGYLEI
jgi:hypothetical protein